MKFCMDPFERPPDAYTLKNSPTSGSMSASARRRRTSAGVYFVSTQ